MSSVQPLSSLRNRVFLASTLSQAQCRALTERIARDSLRGRRWIIQEALEDRESAPAWTRRGEMIEVPAHSKFSGFYGPGGLLSILVMQKAAPKVHGSADTVMSVVL